MAAGDTVAERARNDLPAGKHLLLVVCTLLECLPFLEGSSDSAVDILTELIKGPPCASPSCCSVCSALQCCAVLSWCVAYPPTQVAPSGGWSVHRPQCLCAQLEADNACGKARGMCAGPHTLCLL